MYNKKHGRTRYGVSDKRWLEMLEEWDGLCASCLEEPATHLDHDHTTGVVRAPLCGACNLMLGHAKDNADRLRSAIEYLEMFAQSRTRESLPDNK